MPSTKFVPGRRKLTLAQRASALYLRFVLLVKEHAVALNIFGFAMGYVALMAGFTMPMLAGDPIAFALSRQNDISSLMFFGGMAVMAICAIGVLESPKKNRTSS